jgi:hypothetical protein
MPRTRNRLINAAHRAMIQRAELGRKLGVAGDAFKPKALVNRGKYRLDAKIDDTAHAVQKQFKNNRLPIALAAAAGLAWLFREPIMEHAPRLGRKLRDLAEAGLDKIRPGDAPVDDADPVADIEPVEDVEPVAETENLEDQDEAAQ